MTVGPARSGSEAHAFVEDLEAPVLSPDDRHHLERVLRLRRGARVTVTDGSGAWRETAFGPQLELRGPVVREEPVAPAITVGFALVKGDRPELIVQKLTELGVDRIVPFHASRCVVRWEGDRATKHHQRLVKVAREAAMQSRRATLPIVEPVQEFADLCASRAVALAAFEGEPPSLAQPAVLVGPEGGWTADELGRVNHRVELGPHVLRTESAALTAGALLVAMRMGLVRGR
jgi:16S rRNA (uracil1498-N3)-methyltransferase